MQPVRVHGLLSEHLQPDNKNCIYAYQKGPSLHKMGLSDYKMLRLSVCYIADLFIEILIHCNALR